ncbi:olfactory receptor 14A16-like [Tachyglossus aculeatus]|uniref:olfactory receptor 14A16-like n=1 Tax=Tachyglossus aculeatus TaxID=9261 RepID=UPI0018F7B85D|nr:olfactory receptor 14A16-like [Tachyglossus aculeatus]
MFLADIERHEVQWVSFLTAAHVVLLGPDPFPITAAKSRATGISVDWHRRRSLLTILAKVLQAAHGISQPMVNVTTVTRFLLLGFSGVRELQLVHATLLLLVYDRTCASMLAASWLSGSLIAVLFTASTFSLSFCGPNDVHRFFCEPSQLLRLTCSASHIAEHVSLAMAICLSLLCFVLIIISYVRIFRAVQRMPVAEGRAKAFSTCLPHLFVITLFISSGFFAYLKPVSDTPWALDLLVSVFYTVVPPTLNPLIYSLRNRDMKAAMSKLLGQESFRKEKLCHVNFSTS